ncbi:MAG: DUF4412 domain-containing protein [Flavobacteriaceae bacterium]
MKTLKIISITILFLFVSSTTQAQFFKKLQKKAKEKIEREAERRAERRVNKKIDDAFDKTEETIDKTTKTSKKNSKTSKKSKKAKKHNLPDSYDFEWTYVMQMKTKDGNMNMNYFLKKDANYMGMKITTEKHNPTANMFIILDTQRNVSHTLMDMEGNKIITTIDIPDDDIEEEADENEFTITKTDTKTILGYHCQGFKTITEDGTMNIYVAENAPISFNQIHSDKPKKKQKGFDPKMLKKFENGLVMEMNFVSSKKKKYNVTMTCVSLEKKPFIIKINEYKSFGF